MRDHVPSYKSYTQDKCRCHDCTAASLRYQKRWKLEADRGIRRTIDPTGTRRRLQALMSIGWSFVVLEQEMGVSRNSIAGWLKATRVRRDTAAKVAALYEELSLTPRVGTTWGERQSVGAAHKWAERRGWLPPMAWVNIDDPDEKPDMKARDKSVDEVVVKRILDGDNLPANRAERYAVIERWRNDGRSLKSLRRQTGWNVDRLVREAA